MELGSWADWVNAGGTYAAVIGAGIAACIAWNSYKTQKTAAALQEEVIRTQLAQYDEDKRVRDKRDERAQASKVALWFFRSTYIWGVHVVNSSGLPVFNMTVYFSSPTPSFSVAVERGTQGPTDPMRSVTLTNALRVILETREALNMDPGKLTMEVVFTDAAGCRWRRNSSGLLDEVALDFDFDQADERLIERDLPRDEDYLNKNRQPLAEYPPPRST